MAPWKRLPLLQQAVQQPHARWLQIRERACAVLGYMPLGSAAMLLLSLRSRPSVTLPGGHVVHTVMESKWTHIPLQASRAATSSTPHSSLSTLHT